MAMRFAIVSALAACLFTSAIQAQSTTQASRALYVERFEPGPDGRNLRVIEPATDLRSGDKVVLVVEWSANQAPRGLTVASAIPRTLAFQRSSEDNVQVSVDGGRKWGRLGRMSINDDGRSRLVSPEDVTHLRWHVPPGQVSGGRGRITYRAVVR